MYPLGGDLQNMDKHRGVRVEMRGAGDVLEGQSRRVYFLQGLAGPALF